MKTREAIVIAKQRFGAWVERDQLYFPTHDAKHQWEKHCASIDTQRQREDHFEFNGMRWFGNPRGWDRGVI